MHVPDKSVEPAAFSYVERRRPQSSHGSTKTVRCAVIGWGHLSRASVIVVRICDENSALAPAPALEAMEADLP